MSPRRFRFRPFRPSRLRRLIGWLAGATILGWGVFTLGYPPAFEWYTGVTNPALTFPNGQRVTPAQFDRIAGELTRAVREQAAAAATADEQRPFTRRVRMALRTAVRSANARTDFKHIGYFKEAGILSYEGPRTCLTCHATMTVHGPDGSFRKVDTLRDVADTMHFNFQRMAAGFSTFGYDGREVNGHGRPIPVGKIDRACGIPGSFSWSGWAALIRTRPARGPEIVRSEGCGQCHIGGNTHPATEAMMPVGHVPTHTLQGIDCLICHSAAYDMNQREVLDAPGGLRWNQDRSLKAALAVGRPRAENCLLCHQHNMGGDTYPGNAAAHAPGHEHPRVLHAGAKRGNPFSPGTDVHAAAGMDCTDCHAPQGHKIPRGAKGTDLVGNDLPGTAVECESCHTAAPHTRNRKTRAILNGHVDRLACETCHIKELEHSSVVLRDWVHPVWDAAEGLWTPADILRNGRAGVGFTYLWFNGNGTFLANALGTNPSAPDAYDPLMAQMTTLTGPGLEAQLRQAAAPLAAKYGFNLTQYVHLATHTLDQLTPRMRAERRRIIDENLRPVMKRGKSRLYPFKLFNALMYEDMGNQGPFGAMILPFDYTVYGETGKAEQAMIRAIQNPIVRRMYQAPFKLYMMDEFMHYFGVPSWSATYPMQNGRLVNVETHWMRQMGTLMVNHGIRKEGRDCRDCHAPRGIMDFQALGYPPERVAELQKTPEVEALEKAGI